MKAIWNDAVIAQSDDTVVVEGNHYFPLESLDQSLIEHSKTQTSCPWKGVASYFTLSVAGSKNVDAAWIYKTPKDAAASIKDRVAFWKGVKVTENT